MKKPYVLLICAAVNLLSLSGCQNKKNIQVYDPAETRLDEVATVRVPPDIALVSVDDREVSDGFDSFIGGEKVVQLAPGEHVMVVRYSELWDFNDENYEKFRSEKVSLNFNVEAGGVYFVAHPELSNIKEAAKFEKNPDIWIEQDDVPSGASTTTHNKRTDAEQADTDTVVKNVSDKTDEGTPEKDDSLKKDWDSMTDQEKEAFRKWLEKQ